ncbi:MAG: hypothetical protein IT196_27360 [Acidimicrobiales bacterium]|nr:hypothetical protein [Acidimicrobiales bacterium]
MSHPHRSPRWAGITLGFIAVLGLASCGGDDGGSDDGASTTETIASKEAGAVTADTADEAGSSAGGTAGADSEPEPIELTVGKTGWYDGFAVTVDRVQAVSSFGTEVTVELTYQNLGGETAYAPEARVVLDGEALDTFPEVPEVPGEAKTSGTIVFGLNEEDLDEAGLVEALGTAQLVFGEARDNQTKLPLIPSGTVESTEPKELSVTGTLTHGDLIVKVLGGTLAPSYEEGEKGKAQLDLRFEVSCSATCPGSGFAIDRSMFSVKGADGTSAVADDRSRWCCDAIYPGDIADDADHVVSFVVASPGTGAWTLTFNEPNLTTSGTAPVPLSFTI